VAERGRFRSYHFALESAEGLPIRGSLDLPEAAHALVVVVHGFKGFQEWGFFPWLSATFASEGIAACRFDMSRNGVGESSDTFDRLDLFENDTYSIQLSDLAAVNAYLDSSGLDELPRFFLGHSRGGAIALLGAAERENLSGVITWSSIASVDRWDAATKENWRRSGSMVVENARTRQRMPMSTAILEDVERHRERLDVLAAAARVSAPLLVVHGKADESVSPEESRSIVQAARDASLVLIQGGSHTFGAIHPLIDVPLPLRLAMRVTSRFVTSNAEAALRRIQLSSLRGGGSLPARG
jgi:uncharacterized protein